MIMGNGMINYKEVIIMQKGKPAAMGKLDKGIPDNIGNTFGEDPKTTRIITWQLDSKYEIPGEVIIGSTRYDAIPAYRTVANTSIDAGRNFYRAHISGLSPGTEYEYVCGCEGAYSEKYSFRTEPASSYDGFTIAHVTDPQILDKDTGDAKGWQRTICAAIETADPAFVVCCGDIVEDANTKAVDDYYDYAIDSDGNRIMARYAFVHSGGDNDGFWYNKHYGSPGTYSEPSKPQNYSFLYGSALFINVHYVDDLRVDTDWLVSQLKRKDGSAIKWTIVITHESPYGKSPPQGDIEPEVAYLLYKHDTDLVLAGHNHVYTRSYPLHTKKDADGTIALMRDRSGNLITEPIPVTDENGNERLKYGTVYSIPNYAGDNPKEVEDRRDYLDIQTQPGSPMFSTVTVTPDNITLKYYEVSKSGATLAKRGEYRLR